MKHVFVIATVIFSCLALWNGSQEASQEAVTVAQINNKGVTGTLGVKLGTIVTVEGQVVENDSKAKEDSGEPYFLEISRVNGHALKSPVRYAFRTANQWVKIKEPAVGNKFKYAGYETGGFSGSPDGEFKYVPAYATTGYYFKTEFLVLGEKK